MRLFQGSGIGSDRKRSLQVLFPVLRSSYLYFFAIVTKKRSALCSANIKLKLKYEVPNRVTLDSLCHFCYAGHSVKVNKGVKNKKKVKKSGRPRGQQGTIISDPNAMIKRLSPLSVQFLKHFVLSAETQRRIWFCIN